MKTSPFLKMYTLVRRTVRDVMIRHPALDQRVGKKFAEVDAYLHTLGLLRRFDRNAVVVWDGLEIHFEAADANLARQIYLTQDYEPATRRAILAHLPRGACFVDLGAHIGVFTLLAARAVGPQGHVYAFEPVERTRAVLQRNCVANHVAAQVTIVPYATSDKREQLQFIISTSSEANGIAAAGDSAARIVVDAIDIDSYFRDIPTHIDLIKMDVEGQELATLIGMREVVTRRGRPTIIFEYNLGQIQRLKIDRQRLFAILRDYGYNSFDVLFRGSTPLDLPAQLDELERLASRANVNVLARASR